MTGVVFCHARGGRIVAHGGEKRTVRAAANVEPVKLSRCVHPWLAIDPCGPGTIYERFDRGANTIGPPPGDFPQWKAARFPATFQRSATRSEVVGRSGRRWRWIGWVRGLGRGPGSSGRRRWWMQGGSSADIDRLEQTIDAQTSRRWLSGDGEKVLWLFVASWVPLKRSSRKAIVAPQKATKRATTTEATSMPHEKTVVSRLLTTVYQVGARGLEPPTSWSRTKRSSQAELRPDHRQVTLP